MSKKKKKRKRERKILHGKISSCCKIHNYVIYNTFTGDSRYIYSILILSFVAENINDVLLQEISSIDCKIYFTKESFARKQRRCLQLSKGLSRMFYHNINY